MIKKLIVQDKIKMKYRAGVGTFIFATVLLLFLAVNCSREYKLVKQKGSFYPKKTVASMYQFQIKAENATLITIAGTFNGWNSQISELRQDKNGIWSITIPLKKGITYSYKFLMDGHWVPDPSNPDMQDDGFGGFNSVYRAE